MTWGRLLFHGWRAHIRTMTLCPHVQGLSERTERVGMLRSSWRNQQAYCNSISSFSPLVPFHSFSVFNEHFNKHVNGICHHLPCFSHFYGFSWYFTRFLSFIFELPGSLPLLCWRGPRSFPSMPCFWSSCCCAKRYPWAKRPRAEARAAMAWPGLENAVFSKMKAVKHDLITRVIKHIRLI